MTKPAETRRCRWCGRPFAVRTGPGRPRDFCKRSCRQRDYEARQRSREGGGSESELIVARGQLDALYDQLYVLEAAIEDVDRDVERARTAGDYRDAVEWLLEAARPLVAMRLDGSGH